MHRCLLPSEAWNAERALLPAEASHHLVHVVRAREGERVEVFDGCGREATARYIGMADGRAVLEFTTPARNQAQPETAITLYQSIAKGKRMDWIIEKGVELGLTRIVPMDAERCVVRLKNSQAESRVQRWQKKAESAAQQCHTARVPIIDAVGKLGDLVPRAARADLFLVAAIQPDARPLRDVLSCIGSVPRSIAFAIGPEGDFTKAEIDCMVDAGAIPVSLGRHVLRVETAAVYTLSVLAYEFLA